MKPELIEDAMTLGRDALPHLWKDESGYVSALTKRMEIYPFSKSVLGCLCWHRKTYLQLHKMDLIFDVHETDDRLYAFKTDRSNLPILLSLGVFKRRPHKNGRWIKDKERRLGHRIRPFTAEQKSVLKAQLSNREKYKKQGECELVYT